MIAKKKVVNFNNYWDFLKREAELRNLSDTDLMEMCHIPRQRYYEFTDKRNLTGTYMYRLMEGMRMTIEAIENQTGIEMTADQKKELKRETWITEHPNIVDALLQYPELVKSLELQISAIKKK